MDASYAEAWRRKAVDRLIDEALDIHKGYFFARIHDMLAEARP